MASDHGRVKAKGPARCVPRWTTRADEAITSPLRLETDLADGAHITDGPTDVPDAPRQARSLTYPLGAPPAPGEAVEAAPGVLWLRLSMPLALDHINVYALEDGDGWTVVDTGLNLAPSREVWAAALAGPLGGRPVKRVICTHMHPDHIGLAGWLCAQFDAPLLMTRLEYVTARMLVADTGQPMPEAAAAFHHRAGWSEAQIERLRREWGRFGQAVSPLPTGFERLSEDQVLSIGGRDWRVVIGDGHSPEHACLWREDDGVFLSGDQILPKISSIISVFATEPLADPLGDWMDSLKRLRERLPEDLLVLPSHGEPFQGVHARLEALARGHQTALKRLERTLARPCRAIDVFSALFARAIDDSLLGMATGESLAHLNHLERQGRAIRSRDAEGVEWWTAVKGQEEEA